MQIRLLPWASWVLGSPPPTPPHMLVSLPAERRGKLARADQWVFEGGAISQSSPINSPGSSLSRTLAFSGSSPGHIFAHYTRNYISGYTPPNFLPRSGPPSPGGKLCPLTLPLAFQCLDLFDRIGLSTRTPLPLLATFAIRSLGGCTSAIRLEKQCPSFSGVALSLAIYQPHLWS